MKCCLSSFEVASFNNRTLESLHILFCFNNALSWQAISCTVIGEQLKFSVCAPSAMAPSGCCKYTVCIAPLELQVSVLYFTTQCFLFVVVVVVVLRYVYRKHRRLWLISWYISPVVFNALFFISLFKLQLDCGYFIGFCCAALARRCSGSVLQPCCRKVLVLFQLSRNKGGVTPCTSCQFITGPHSNTNNRFTFSSRFQTMKRFQFTSCACFGLRP